MKGSNMNMLQRVDSFQKRYTNVLGVLTIDLRSKAQDSVNVSTQELITLRNIGMSELRMLRKYYMSGDTLKHTRFNERMNQIVTSLDMIHLALKNTNPLNERYFMQVARIAIACLLDR